MGFVWMLFGVVLFYAQEVSSTPYVSTISRSYTKTELGRSFFACYSSDSVANVTTGRYISTYFGLSEPANDPPPPSTRVDVGSPPRPTVQTYLTRLLPYAHTSYGVFYCASAYQSGEITVVPTIFLRSDAKFVPTNGRFSKTVNKGEVDVIIDFTEVTTRGLEKEWMFNGTTNLYETRAFGSSIGSRTSTNYTIPGEVDISDAGVYEIYLGGERGLARAGLLRLIVRACPAGRYNPSGGCFGACPSCFNGGVCHDETGICVCPPGFQGYQCEQACGGNRFGRDCECRCNNDFDNKKACIGRQVCVPDPYGCSCTPGFKGLNCTTECGPGEFGASCTEACHCVSGECDQFTGVCTGSSTECQPGWIGVNCQDQSGFSSPLIVNGTTNESVTLVWGAWNESRYDGDYPPIRRYRVLYRLVSSQPNAFRLFPKTDLVPSERVTGLSPDTDYVFAVAARGPVTRLTVLGRTKCSPPYGIPMALTASPSPYLRTIHVNWKNPPPEANCRSGFIGVRIYWEVNGSPSIFHGSIDVVLNASIGYNLTSLEPFTRYRVSAVMLNRDDEGQRSEPSEAMTAEEIAPPPSEIQYMTGSSFIIVKWNAPAPGSMNGRVIGCTMNYTRVQPPSTDMHSELLMPCQVTNNIYLIEGVQEGEIYEIQMNTVNGFGSGEWSAKTLVEIVGGSGFSLSTVLLSSIIPSAIALVYVIITVFILVFRKRASDHWSPKDEEKKKNTVAATHCTASHLSEEIYENVQDDEHTYQEFQLTSVQPDEPYMELHTK